MRTRMGLLLVSTLVVASAGGRAQGAVVDKESFVGKQAATSFAGSATIHCAAGGHGTVSASGFLSGSQTISKSTGTPTVINNGVFVEVDSYSNTCTGATLGFADGGIANGFTPPSARLNSAEIAGTTTVQDFDTGTQIAVVIDVVFEGTGPLSVEKSNTKTKTVNGPHGPVTITLTSSASASRAADASGTISVGGVAIDTTFTSTTLSDNANATITIEKK